jgi:hypothetical protein
MLGALIALVVIDDGVAAAELAAGELVTVELRCLPAGVREGQRLWVRATLPGRSCPLRPLLPGHLGGARG